MSHSIALVELKLAVYTGWPKIPASTFGGWDYRCVLTYLRVREILKTPAEFNFQSPVAGRRELTLQDILDMHMVAVHKHTNIGSKEIYL